MAVLSDISGVSYWTAWAQQLFLEAQEAQGDDERSANINLELYRILADRIDKSRDGHHRIDTAASQAPNSADVAWEWWRAAGVRDSGSQRSALERLASLIERSDVAAACHLALARLKEHHQADGSGAGESLSAASVLEPDSRGVLWARTIAALASGDDEEVESLLEELSAATEDPIWRASLELELASCASRTDAGVDQVVRHLSNALEQPGIGWTVAHDVMRTSIENGDSELAERALTKIAESALDQPAPVSDERPPGHFFSAFKLGPKAAAAHFLIMTRLRETGLGDPTAALEALERALALVPESSYLIRERARLLEAAGRHAEALGALPDDAPTAWRAELALTAGQLELASQLARTAAAESPSVLPQTIAEVAEVALGTAPESDPGPQDPEDWLMAHPDHPDALAVARDLISAGSDLLVARLLVEERDASDRHWPGTEHVPDGAEWTTALEAVTGAEKAQADTYSRWAEAVTTPELEALLVAAAARAAESSGDNERSLELCRQALELDPDHAESRERLIRLLRELAKWSELADRIADRADGTSDPDAALAALHERAIVLEYALDDPSSAVEALGDLTARNPEDVAAILSQTRLALRASDWEAAVEYLGQLVDTCPADKPWIELLRGEILLHALGREVDALDHLSSAAEGLTGSLERSARFHAIYAAYLAGDTESLDERLRREIEGTADDVRGMWLPEMLETSRAFRGAGAVAELIDAGPSPTATRHIWQAIAAASSRDAPTTARSLESLAEVAPPGAVADSCRAAAMLLDDYRPLGAQEIARDESPAGEMLWHAIDRLPADADAELRAELCHKRSELVREDDPLDWADWQLCRAEALEDADEPRRALEVLSSTLEALPDHPGLLEARADLCLHLEEFELAVETCRELSRYFDSDDQKAAQLARAAMIIFHHLGDEARAEELVREALEQAPGNEFANEVLTKILSDRGDDRALAQQIEDRIDAEYDSEALVALYQEQADRLYAVDDLEGALESIENLLLLAPDDHAAHRTKIDILLSAQDWQASYQALGEFIEVLEDPVERRSMIWRAAELRAQYLDEIDEALEMLEYLVEQGDEHPQTFRYIAEIGKRGNRWDEAASGLERYARVVEEDRQVEALREKAKIELENLFDPDAAIDSVKQALAVRPADLELIKFAADFREPEDTQRALEAAQKDLLAALKAKPIDSPRVAALEETATLLEEPDVAAKCHGVLEVLDGVAVPTGKTERAITKAVDPAQLRALLVHPDEPASAASRVAALCAGMANSVFGKSGAFPDTGRSTLVGKRSKDPVRVWLKQWADLLGIDPFAMHRVPVDGRGSNCLPGEPPSVAVSPELTTTYDAVERFYLARHLWRSSQGLGAFQEGDAAGPVRWIMAATMAALGDDARPPLPTDIELVTQARKAMPRKVRKALIEPCQQLVQETPKSIRAWLHAATYTADRIGLLAAGDLRAVIRPLIEDSAGPSGVRRYEEGPADALAKVPRGVEAVGFALSPEYLQIERITGLLGEGTR